MHHGATGARARSPNGGSGRARSRSRSRSYGRGLVGGRGRRRSRSRSRSGSGGRPSLSRSPSVGRRPSPSQYPSPSPIRHPGSRGARDLEPPSPRHPSNASAATNVPDNPSTSHDGPGGAWTTNWIHDGNYPGGPADTGSEAGDTWGSSGNGRNGDGSQGARPLSKGGINATKTVGGAKAATLSTVTHAH
jgi:hypothetical protein